MTTLTRALSKTNGNLLRALSSFSLRETMENFGSEELPLYYDPGTIREEFDGVSKEINLLGLRFRLYDLLMGWWERKSNRDLINFIDDAHPAHNILEMGVGTGYLLRLICARYPNARVRASDLSLNMLAVAREKLVTHGQSPEEVTLIDEDSAHAGYVPKLSERVSLVQENCLHIGDDDESQDTIISAYFLDLLPPEQIDKALNEIARLLAPGGKAFLMSLTAGIEKNSAFAGKTSALYFRMRNGFYGLWYHSKFLRELSHALLDGYYTHCRPIRLSQYLAGCEHLVETRARLSFISICGVPYLPVKIIEVMKK